MSFFFFSSCMYKYKVGGRPYRKGESRWMEQDTFSLSQQDGREKMKRPLLHIQGYTTTTLFFFYYYPLLLASRMDGRRNEWTKPQTTSSSGAPFFFLSPLLSTTRRPFIKTGERERDSFFYYYTIFLSYIFPPSGESCSPRCRCIIRERGRAWMEGQRLTYIEEEEELFFSLFSGLFCWKTGRRRLQLPL